MGQGIVYDINGTELGNFDAMVSAEAMAIHYDLESSIHEIPNLSTSVYPNPAVNQIHIESNSEIEELAIYSLNGQLLSSIAARSSKTYDLRELKSGTYLLKIKNADGIAIQKLVKQ